LIRQSQENFHRQQATNSAAAVSSSALAASSLAASPSTPSDNLTEDNLAALTAARIQLQLLQQQLVGQLQSVGLQQMNGLTPQQPHVISQNAQIGRMRDLLVKSRID